MKTQVFEEDLSKNFAEFLKNYFETELKIDFDPIPVRKAVKKPQTLLTFILRQIIGFSINNQSLYSYDEPLAFDTREKAEVAMIVSFEIIFYFVNIKQEIILNRKMLDKYGLVLEVNLKTCLQLLYVI
jgi:hypothetical protein